MILVRRSKLTSTQMEKMIALTASLPRTSATRKKLSGVIVDTLWSSLQHPPLTYMGDKFQYRTPDGSYNVSSTALTKEPSANHHAEPHEPGPRKGREPLCPQRAEAEVAARRASRPGSAV